MIDRRAFLATTAALAMPMAAYAAPRDIDRPSLNSLAASKGILFGTAISAGQATARAGTAEEQYRAVVLAECGALVCENEMKWPALRPDAATFDFSRSDAIVALAQGHGMKMRGHTLLWHHPDWFPRWLTDYDFGSRPAVEGERVLQAHIRRVGEHYPQVVSWDVINEAIDADTGERRETSLSRAMGPEVLDVAFHTAREAAPKARLLYNDYMSWEAGHENHRAGVLKLLEGFKARGVPIDGLGVQSHIGSGNADNSVGFDTAQETQWRRFLDEVTGMGLTLEITEFDVHDKNLPADPVVRDREVAALGRRYLDLMLEYPQLDTVMAWGMSDRYTWLQGRWPRADGLPKRTNPYDAEFKAKPLREAMAASFQAAAPRPQAI